MFLLAELEEKLGRLYRAFVGDDHHNPRIIQMLMEIKTEMSELSDAIAANTQAVTDNTAATNAAVAKITAIVLPSDAADVAAAVTALGTNTAQTKANTDALNAAQPPA